MLRHLLVLSAVSIFLFLGGCGLLKSPSYTEAHSYDLGSSDEKVPAPVNVELGLFTDKSGNGNRMVIRHADGVRISHDEYNRFSASPALLVKRRLAVCFAPVNTPQKLAVSGDLLRFEYLAGKKVVRMVIDYRIDCNGKKRVLRQELEEKVSGSGSAAAAGFEKCIVQSARALAGEIGAFAKECAKEKK